MLSFRIADPVSDAERFTRWMNDPRVGYFWGAKWLTGGTDRLSGAPAHGKHAFPLIGCFNDRPFSYFEIYWAAEDRIGRHYSWQPLTVACICWLVNSNGAGPTMCKAGCAVSTHYLLLDEPRTQRTVLELAPDNLSLFQLSEPAGYRTIKEFDFPHKRSRAG